MITYVRGPNPIWFFNNLTGMPLDDTYYAFFLTNDLPYVPSPVYQDPNGISPWSDPIEFQPSGGLPNNLYFNPTLVYRIEIRQGPDQTYPLIWLVQNYVPGEGGAGGSTITDPLTVAANLITDPNFSDLFFSSPYTYIQGTPGTYTLNVAPGWQLILTGAGTTVLTQGTLAGSSNTFGNPSYYLEVNNTGWTTAILTQTLSNNGALFANGAIAVAFTAQAVTTAQNITVNYVPNGTANSQTIVSAPVTTGGFVEYYGAVDLNPSTNTNTDGAGNVQIQFVLPGTGNVELTNIQVTGQSVPLSVNFTPPPRPTIPGSVPNYQELTYGQIVNAEFNIYRDSILNHPKDTILTGWNFALNPWQSAAKTVTNIAANQYTADQTIVLQEKYISSSGATGNNVAVGQAADTYNYGLQVNAVTANNQFALLQYIDASTIRPYWGQNLSAMVKALLVTTQSSMITFKMRLIYIAGTPSSTSDAYPIETWAAGQDPVFASGVTAIVPQNDPVYTLSAATPMLFPFNKFMLPASSNVNMTLGVLLYTTSNMSTTGPDSIIFNEISLVQNDFAILSNPETYDEVLRKCQFYYEKSYEPGVLPGANTGINQKSAPQFVVYDGSTYSNLYQKTFQLDFVQTKRAAPTVTLYDPAGDSGKVEVALLESGVTETAYGGSANANPFNQSVSGEWTPAIYLDRAIYTCANTTSSQITTGGAGSAAAQGDEGIIYYHYVANSRLG